MPNEAMTKRGKDVKRSLVLVSIILGMFMSAIEGTIVATAIPDIVGDLGGFSLYSWIFSAYLLMNALTILIYGKLADLFGRKPIFMFGLIIFLIGSLLAGYSQSMLMLIIFRLIQGLGAGAVQPIAMTIVGDLYSIEERGKIQGYLSSVWGISAVIGPALGGFFVQYLNWSWVFWLNVPLGILSVLGIKFFFHENVNPEKHKIDYAGSGLLFLALSSLMIILIQGGAGWKWLSWQVLLLALIFVTGLIFFLVQENRAKEPIVPLHIWKNRMLSIANSASLTAGIVMIGLTSFLPAFVQVVMGRSAIVAGFTLTAMSIGWPIASTITGRLILKLGYRPLAVIGGIALIIGSLFFVFLDAGKGPLWAGLGSFITGIGMGMTSTTFIISIQNSVPWKVRGVATASNMFMRMMGSAIGAAMLGGILNSQLKQFIINKGAGEQLSIDSANRLLGSSHSSGLSPQALELLKTGLTEALHNVYLGVFLFAVLSFLLVLFFPKGQVKPDKK